MLAKTAILVPYDKYIEPACENSLRAAEQAGYYVYRRQVLEPIDAARNLMLQRILDLNYEHIIWVAPNVVFKTHQLAKLHNTPYKVVSGLYGVNKPVRTASLFDTKQVEVPTGFLELTSIGCGFLYTHRAVYEAIIKTFKLVKVGYPSSNVYPFFMASVEDDVYYDCELSFCNKIRKAGFRIFTSEDLCLESVIPQTVKFLLGTEKKLPPFLDFPRSTTSLEDYQEFMDKTTARSMDLPYRRIWDSIHEVNLHGPEFRTYNPSILKYKGDLWMFYRRDDTVQKLFVGFKRGSTIRAVKLDSHYQPIASTDHHINIPPKWEDTQFEDPKVATDGEIIILSMVEPNLKISKSNIWIFAVKVAELILENDKFNVIHADMPKFGKNPGQEKNWAPFFHDSRVYMNYSMQPHVVFNLHDFNEVYEGLGVAWNTGEVIHGGTPPQRVGDRLYSFMHGKYTHPKVEGYPLAYMMGCVEFEAKPPFTVTRFTKAPIMWSDLGPDLHRHISCIFPAGAVYEDNKWSVSYGNNDKTCRIVTIPHDRLLKSLS